MALAVGTWAFGNLTEFEAEQITEGSPTTSAPATTTQPAWRLVETVSDRVPFAVIEHRGQVFVLTSLPPAQTPQPTGLQVWRSADGVTWVPEGTVIRPDSKVESVGSTALGLFAIGSIGDDDTTRAWLSADGVKWLPLIDGLPIELSDSPRSDPRTVALTDNASLDGIASVIGSDASVVELEMLTNQGIALITRTPDPSRPYEIDSFEIWQADLN